MIARHPEQRDGDGIDQGEFAMLEGLKKQEAFAGLFQYNRDKKIQQPDQHIGKTDQGNNGIKHFITPFL